MLSLSGPESWEARCTTDANAYVGSFVVAETKSVPEREGSGQAPRERRAHQRKPPRGRCIVKLFRGTLGLGQNLALELVDVSLSGAKLRLSQNLRPGEEVTVELLGQGHLRPVKSLARVIWCRPADQGFLTGLTFEKPLSYADFLHLT
ncbi:hypothetical protein HRbin36_00942 [bacterium HR36]|nr:hypothetical protein HRbin36_00942 [bacterium HR36]